MSIWGVIIGSFGQVMLGFMLFMLAVFGGTSAVNARSEPIGKIALQIINVAFYALPLSSVLTAGFVIYLYASGSATSSAYWWHTLPLLLGISYYVFLLKA